MSSRVPIYEVPRRDDQKAEFFRRTPWRAWRRVKLELKRSIGQRGTRRRSGSLRRAMSRNRRAT